jgi:hypothetical protein
MVFAKKGEDLDKLWTTVYKLYHQRKLSGIRSAKVSTMKQNQRASSSSEGVICLYCGPYSNQELMISIGENLVKELDYHSDSGFMTYKSDVMTNQGTRATGN